MYNLFHHGLECLKVQIFKNDVFALNKSCKEPLKRIVYLVFLKKLGKFIFLSAPNTTILFFWVFSSQLTCLEPVPRYIRATGKNQCQSLFFDKVAGLLQLY